MPDYSLGKIYKIVGNGKVYVGSTTRPLLSQRLAKHKSEYKGWVNGTASYVASYECVDDPDCYIELIELYPCSCVDELRKCEGKWIRELECVNRCVAGRTFKEYKKEWREANKEQIVEQSKAYYEANKEEIAEKQKAYYEANKEQRKAYQEANREKIVEYMKAYYLKKKSEQQ